MEKSNLILSILFTTLIIRWKPVSAFYLPSHETTSILYKKKFFANNLQHNNLLAIPIENLNINPQDVTKATPLKSHKRMQEIVGKDSSTQVPLDSCYENISSSNNSDKPKMMKRRKMFQHCLTSAALTCVAISSNTNPSIAAETKGLALEELKLGKGIWNDSNDKSTTALMSSSLPSDDIDNTNNSNLPINIPWAFSNYASRFLIQYDPAVRNWWESQISLIDSNDDWDDDSLDKLDKIMDESFYSLQLVIHDAIFQFLSNKKKDNVNKEKNIQFEQLAGIFISKYSIDEAMNDNNEIQNGDSKNSNYDIYRHIAIMFTLLPSENQPKEQLKKLMKKLDSKNLGNSSQMRIPLKINEKGKEKYSLLPKPYSILSYSSNAFRINPTLDDPNTMFGTSPFSLQAFGEQRTTSLTSSLSSITRTRPTYTPTIYALLGLAGGLGCTLTHTIVVPLDVVKTRMQTDPMLLSNNVNHGNKSNDEQNKVSNNKIMNSAKTIIETEGVSGLFLGLQATIIGYLWYGISVYPSYTFFKRFLLFQSATLLPFQNLVGGGGNIEVIISLLAGAMSAVLASLGLTPLEACRIRAVAEPQTYAPLGVTGTAAVIASENPARGWTNLYAGLPSLLTRQVVFGSVKFLAFEKAVDAIYTVAPNDWSTPGSAGALTISLLAGGFAGCISSIISQPADSVLTYVAQNSSSGKALGVLDGCRIMVNEGGVSTLFRGLGSRCVWAGSIIAGQFLLYDVFKSMLGVDTESLKQVFQIVIDS